MGPHNAALEPRKVLDDVAVPFSFPGMAYVHLPLTTAAHLMVDVSNSSSSTTVFAPRQARNSIWKPHVSCLDHIHVVYEDGSSIADYSTPGKYEGRRDEQRSMIEPTIHNGPNMQFVPLAKQDPFAPSLTDERRAKIVESFDSVSTVPDQGVFDSRNGGPPVRGLYRNFPGHREQLIEMQTAHHARERRKFEAAIECDGSDWAVSDVGWAHSANELAQLTPVDRQAAVKLAKLSAGNRDGFVVGEEVSEHLPTSNLMAMDKDNASREWKLHPANDNKKTSDIPSSTISTSDERHVELLRSSIQSPGRSQSIVPSVTYIASTRSHLSLADSNAFDAALLQQEALGTVHIPTGSEIIQNDPISTPKVFHDRIPRCGQRPRSGKMASTTQLPDPVTSLVENHVCLTSGPVVGEDALAQADIRTDAAATADAANEAFFASEPVTDHVISLLQPLEREHAQLSEENKRLMAVLEETQALMRTGSSAYENLDKRTAARMKELDEENARLRSDLAGKVGEIEHLREMLVEKDG